jgi:sigma-E factor negative regulatory protein RseA
MDGELGKREARDQIKRVEQDQQLSKCWDTYHLIGDVLRNERELPPGFAHRLRERLETEPVVFALHQRLRWHVARYALPLTGGVAGVVVVAMLATVWPWRSEPPVHVAAPQMGAPLAPPASNGSVSEYLLAHQEFSPRTAMQGVASYVRTVAASGPEAAR